MALLLECCALAMPLYGASRPNCAIERQSGTQEVGKGSWEVLSNASAKPATRLQLARNVRQELLVRVHYRQAPQRRLERAILALADGAAQLDDALHALHRLLDARIARLGGDLKSWWVG